MSSFIKLLLPNIINCLHPFISGSTSIQNNFHEWTGEKKYLLKQWSWPVPALVTKYESQDEHNWNWNPSKGFYALAELLRDQHHPITDRLVYQKNTRERILHAYQMEFLKAWMAGYSLIIGSEAFDNVIKDDDGDDMIDRFIDLLPFFGDEEEFDIDRITVVVTYRVPRVKHLISIWRETKKKNESFQKWIMTTRNRLGATDSLGLAEKFLEKGFKVVIADIHGISEEGYDISNIIACQILNATCTDDMQLVGSDPPLVMNTKQNFNGSINLNEDQLDLMDMVMQRYDCKYLEMFDKYKDNDQLMTIYPTALLNVIQSCGDREGDQKKIPDRATMKELLVCIADGNEVCE